MVLRVLANLILFFSVFFMPFWFSCILALFFMFYFNLFVEVIILMFISDLFFGIKDTIFPNFIFFSSCIFSCVFILLEILKRKLKFYPKLK